MIFQKPRLKGAYSTEVVNSHQVEVQCTSLRAISSNLLWDERVSEPRGAAFLTFVSSDPARGFDACLNKYVGTQKNVSKPDYTDVVLNKRNILAVKPMGSLVHVLDLSVRFEAINIGVEKMRGPRPAIFSDSGFPEKQPREYPEWLNKVLGGRESQRDRALDAILSAVTQANRTGGKRPVWTAAHLDFERFVTAGPDRWIEAMGMKSRVGNWLVLLAYPVSDVPDLIRPTILESGSHFHVPSPDATECGYAADLGAPSLDTPVREYVHRPIPLKLDYCKVKDADGNAAVRCGQVKGTTVPDKSGDFTPWLFEVRKAHRARLSPFCDGAWLPESEL